MEFKNKIKANFDSDKNEDKKDYNSDKDQYKDKSEYTFYYQEKVIQELIEEKNQLKIKVNILSEENKKLLEKNEEFNSADPCAGCLFFHG